MSGLLTLSEVTRLVGYSRTSIWRLTRDGKFPQPVKTPSGHNRFHADEIAEWIEALPRKGEDEPGRAPSRKPDAPVIAAAAAGAPR